jgi:hypothetical protein
MTWLDKLGNTVLYGHPHGKHYYEQQWDDMEMGKEDRLAHWKSVLGEDPDHTLTESLPATPRTPATRRSATNALMRLDMRHTHDMTFDDFCKMYGASGTERGELRAIFDTIDIDKNGVIDLDEYLAFMGPQTPNTPFFSPQSVRESGDASGGRPRVSRKKASRCHRSRAHRLRRVPNSFALVPRVLPGAVGCRSN